MDTDYRSEPMESPEGKGRARSAWQAYQRTAKRALDPVLGPAVRPMAASMAVDLVGFWACWHIYGGFEGLERLGMHRSTIYRKVKRFRTAYGAHPDEYVFPGITLDPKAYWDASAKRQARRKRS